MTAEDVAEFIKEAKRLDFSLPGELESDVSWGFR